MFPKQKISPINFIIRSNKQTGSALVIAVFIIVVMSLIGLALVRLLSSSAESVAYEVIGTRAYAAAQSGAQWQLMRTFPFNNAAAQCNLTQEMTMPSIKGLSACEVNVTCEATAPYNGVIYYTISSEAVCTVGNVITSRTIEIEARTL